MKPRHEFLVSSLASAIAGALAAGVSQAQEQAPTTSANRPATMEQIIVTAARREQTLGSISASMEIIDAAKLENTPAYVVTDILKKNSSVDVIQYPGGTSGVGIRGFRPQFSGVNQRVLVLVDGRPAGATSMSNIARAGLERVEVVKGSSSSIYGPSAMGGVVNYITRHSEGEIDGNFSVGLSSFDTTQLSANTGGSLGERFSFDVGVTHSEQADNYALGEGGETFGTFVQGQGGVRPNTTFEQRSFFGRGSMNLTDNWEAQLRLFAFDEPNTETPGAESDGVNNQGVRRGNNLQQELSFTGDMGKHSLLAVVYATQEVADTYDRPPAAPEFLSFARDTNFEGLQIQDNWSLGDRYNLIVGMDYGFAESEARSYQAGNIQVGASTPDFERLNTGLFADLTADWLDGRVVFNFGARYDEIESRVLETPLRTDLTPGTAKFDTVNPRAGIVFRPRADGAVRIHASAGTGFIAPDASQVAGYSEQIVGSQLRITRGNPTLEPEDSVSFDVGVGYEAERFNLDVTYFDLGVDNRIESVIVTNTPTLRETTYVNAQGSTAEGIEAQLTYDLGALFGGPDNTWASSLSLTRYFKRDQELATGIEPLRNVAEFKVNFDFSYTGQRFGARLNGRHVDGMFDNDFSAGRIFTNGAGGIYEYPSFLVYDATAFWKITEDRRLFLQVDNLRNDYYYEKLDYPMPGRAYHLSYKHAF